LSGDGTLKQGDSLNLTCDVNCTHSSSQFVWSKNNEQLNTSGPVLHFPALTVRDSGNYTCTWKTNEASGSKTISLQVEGDSTEDPEDLENLGTPKNLSIWMIVLVTAGVMFMVFALPAVIYNRRSQATKQLNQVPQADEEVLDNELLIYAPVCVKPNKPTKQLSGNGTLKQGDSLNLTCDVTCTHNSSQFVWSKNNEQLNTSGPVLHFPALTVRDSASYTCTWKTNETSGSKTISLQVEDENKKIPETHDMVETPWPIWIVVMVTAVVILIVSVVTVS
ncbi:myeloid cell surface antigen CD33-like isoform X1, partial [Clarias magur]